MPTRAMFGAGLVHLSRKEIERMKRSGWVEHFPAPVEYLAVKFDQPKPFTEWRMESVYDLYRLHKAGR